MADDLTTISKRGMRRARPGGLRAPAAVALLAALLAGTGCADTGDPPDGAGAAEEGGEVGEVASPEPSVDPWTPELAAELRRMGEEDQAVRADFGPETVTDTAFMGRMIRTDSALSIRLRELVDRHGWPRASVVGDSAANAAFLVVQHTPFDAWQRAMLPEVEEAVRAGELDGQDFALLFDRIRVREGRPQRYGTQLDRAADGRLHPEPLEDPAAVDSLRATLGLPPLEAYWDVVEEAYGMEVVRDGSAGG